MDLFPLLVDVESFLNICRFENGSDPSDKALVPILKEPDIRIHLLMHDACNLDPQLHREALNEL